MMSKFIELHDNETKSPISMKSLDDVINAIDVCSHGKGCEHCCYRIVNEDGFEMYLDCPEKDVDALHYLREYQIEKNKSGMDRLKEVLREVRGEI